MSAPLRTPAQYLADVDALADGLREDGDQELRLLGRLVLERVGWPDAGLLLTALARVQDATTNRVVAQMDGARRRLLYHLPALILRELDALDGHIDALQPTCATCLAADAAEDGGTG